MTNLTPIRVELPKGGQYSSDRNDDGTWNVRDVPCFVENGQYDRAWCERAVQTARERRERGEYVSPLHLRHHDVYDASSAVEAAAVEAAGLFAPARVDEIDFEGKRKAAVFADWLKVPDPIYQRIKGVQLPYRSVEILRGSGELDSCALLDHEPPRFRLPLTTIGREHFRAGGAVDVFMLTTSEESYVTTPNTNASGAPNSAPPANNAPGQPAGNAPASQPPPAPPAAAPALDVNAIAAAIAAAIGPTIAQCVNGAMVAANAGKTNPQPGDPAPTDGVTPAEQGAKDGVPAKADEPALAAFKLATSQKQKALEDRVASAEKFAAALTAERATDKAVRAAAQRLEKAGHKVDEKYEGELRARAEKGLAVLEEHVATRERFSLAEPQPWSGGAPRVQPKAPPELEAFRAQGPEAYGRAQEAAAEYFRMPAVQRESLPLAEFLKYSAKPSAGVAVNGQNAGEN